MSFLRKKNRSKVWVIFGVGVVTSDKETGDAIKYSQPSKTTGERKIQFKACGSKHKCDKPYADGRERWKYEDANFYVWSGHPLAKTARALKVGDCIEVHGVLCVSNYISATGKQKRYFEWKLEKLVVLYHQDGNLPTNEEYTPAEVDESELDELFDDL